MTKVAIVICPHCGDRTEQEFLLQEFTCGACDRPFRPSSEPIEAHDQCHCLTCGKPSKGALCEDCAKAEEEFLREWWNMDRQVKP